MSIRSLKESLKRFLRDAEMPASLWLVEWAITIFKTRRAYRRSHGRTPRLLSPVRYTEKIQWRKLFDLNPIYTVLSDKLAVRGFIAERAGPDLLIPLLWSGENPGDIPFASLRRPYVIKSTHASGHVIMVGEHDPVDTGEVVATARSWLGQCHGKNLGEPGYVDVPRRIMVESQVQAVDGTRPMERKVFVFGGKVRMINTTVFEGGILRNAAFHTADWQPLSWHVSRPLSPERYPRPGQFDLLMDAAQRVGAGFDHVRVDFYDTGSHLYIGEITVYSWSGRLALKPDEADFILGSYWEIRHPFVRALATMLRGRRITALRGRDPKTSRAI